MKSFIATFFIATILLTGCKNSEKTTIIKQNKPVESLISKNTHQIVLLEKIEAGGYVYIKVLEKKKEYWMAIPGRPLEIGATYYYDEGAMEMGRYESKSLKRTFENIIFAQGIRDEINPVKKATKRTINKGKSNVVNVDKATNGIRIATLFENLKEYENKQVIIKGKVVKVNNGILGVNFIHLQDGTKGNGEFDITVTSNETFKKDEVVTVKGNVVFNKDFGSGYVYDVLIEKAEILK